MNHSNYIKIYTGNFITVQRIVSVLKNINISAVIKDESESGRLAGFGASIQGQQEIYVNKDEFDEAILAVGNVISEFKV
ncbi:hypothetical protein A8C32_02575 [Flavivirga aquatica]|uniref:DUF2007 domain-containing protein n=1 Tax=Flavivirga aquatica TaxID=1849968 RepID=A0A1E5TAG2_9FLAO|nr:DUF2007 domain-containing protein [Flavivirga aquatica]OEK08354.1 hypothetical protein A8C32_02575 [Flavivirga aquatica]